MNTFRIRAIDYLRSSYRDTTPGNQGSYAASGDADTFTIADSVYPAKIGNHVTGEWYEYNATVPTTGLYSVSFVYSLGNVGGQATSLLEVDSAFCGSFPVGYSGGWDVCDRSNPQLVRLVAGTRRFRHTMQTNACDFWGYEFSLVQAEAQSIDIPDSYTFEALSLTEDYKTFVSKLGDGTEQASSAGLNPIRQTWQVTFIKMSLDEAITLRNIIRNAKGVRSISWRPPTELQPLKWKIRSHTINVQNGYVYSISCKLEQVY